ncbi:MAG TPA: glycohydrolase toxin TNT-related protein [Clostridiales bacterium]|nr:glycohydrolase toxin TNT-related protein [Clostridiales bacterium]
MKGKKLLLRVTSLTLVVAMMSVTLSSCFDSNSINRNTVLGDSNTERLFRDTSLEETSSNINVIYNELNEALCGLSVDDIKDTASKLQQAVRSYADNAKSDNAENKEKVNNLSQDIQERQNDYEEQTDKAVNKVLSALDTIINKADNQNDEAFKQAEQAVYDCFDNSNALTTSDEIIPNYVETQKPKVQQVESLTALPHSEEVIVGSSDDGSLTQTDETVMTDEMKKLADELKTPLNLYLYIKNNINYECYYGSRKGAVATFESNSGNDVDQASLLIAMLRYLDYPAKYVTGTAIIDADQAKELVSADTVANAANILAASGKPVTTLLSGGEIKAIKMEQTWVETYVPYTDYRGAGNNSGDEKWIALDPSVKAYTKIDGIYNKLDDLGITQDEYDKAVSQNNVRDFINKIESLDEASINSDEMVLNTRQIVKEELEYLPLTLQYSVSSISSAYNEVKDSSVDKIKFTIDGQVVTQKKSLDLYGKRLVIEYTPENEQDKQVIDKYGSIFNAPSYLVKMVPQIKLDGEVVGTGNAITLGSDQTLTMTVYSGGDQKNVVNKITAGSVYQVTEDMQTITEKELTKASDEATGIRESINTDNVYCDEYLGKILDLAGKMYFAQVDIANMVTAEQMNMSVTRSLSVGMTGYSVVTSYMFGMPVGINEGNLYIDVDLNVLSVVSRNGEKDAPKKYLEVTGVVSSSYESLIWEELTGEQGVSSINILNEAKGDNQELLMLSRANYDAEKGKLHLSASDKSSIETAINTGKIVTIHTDEVTMGDWSGYGYIITDPASGAAAYMISGGLSGGSTSSEVSLAYIVDIGFAVADFIDALRMIPLMLTAFAAGGPVGIIIGVVIAAFMVAAVISAAMDYCESIQLMQAYMNGDMEAGEALKSKAMFNIGFTAAAGVLGAVGKAAVKAVAKNKIVKEFGEELTEKLLKATDSPTNITRATSKLQKAGLSKDAIHRIADNAGEEGLAWFEKQTKNKVSKDVLENIANHADDYGKYTDNLLNAISKSDGYADDIIKCVNNYGDDASRAIEKYGDNAAIAISNSSSKNMAKVVSNSSDELFDRIMKSNGYADDIAESVSKYGDDASSAIIKSGDDAAVLISEYGKDAVTAINKYGDDAVNVIYDYGNEAITSLNKGIEPNSVKKIYRWYSKPTDDLYIKYKGVFDNNKYYNQVTGEIRWPGQNGDINIDGFLNGHYEDVKLYEGKELDRYGSNWGTFFGETGTPVEKRAMAPTSDFSTYNQYVVKKELPVRRGVIAPWFDEPGLGVQFMLDPTFVTDIKSQLRTDEALIDGLVRLGYLYRIGIDS